MTDDEHSCPKCHGIGLVCPEPTMEVLDTCPADDCTECPLPIECPDCSGTGDKDPLINAAVDKLFDMIDTSLEKVLNRVFTNEKLLRILHNNLTLYFRRDPYHLSHYETLQYYFRYESYLAFRAGRDELYGPEFFGVLV